MIEWLEPLAIVPEWRKDVEWWPEGPALPLAPLVWGMRLVGAAMIAYIGYVAWRRFEVRLSPLRAFVRVAGRMGLGWHDRWVLWRAAKVEGLASPLTLLVCAATLEHHAESIIRRGEQVGGAAMKKARRLSGGVLAVRRRLFD